MIIENIRKYLKKKVRSWNIPYEPGYYYEIKLITIDNQINNVISQKLPKGFIVTFYYFKVKCCTLNNLNLELISEKIVIS